MRSRAVLIGAGVAVLLTLVFFMLLYRPQSARQAELETETAAFVTQRQTLQAQVAALEEVRTREPEIREALTRLGQLIPATLAQPTAIRQLQAMADEAGVDVSAVTFGEPALPALPADAPAAEAGQAGTALVEIPVTMVVEGRYFSVVDLFRRIEVELPRAVLVDNVTIAEETEDGFPRLTSTWTGRLFAVVPVTDAAPADEAAAGAPPAAPDATAAPADTEEPT